MKSVPKWMYLFRARALDLPPSHSEVAQPHLLGLSPVVDVAQVNENLAAHCRSDPVEVERAELVPLGDDDQRIGAIRRRIGVLGKLDTGEDLLGLLARHGIERRDLGSALDQRLDNRNRRGIAHVIGVRLEREPEHADALATALAAESAR